MKVDFATIFPETKASLSSVKAWLKAPKTEQASRLLLACKAITEHQEIIKDRLASLVSKQRRTTTGVSWDDISGRWTTFGQDLLAEAPGESTLVTWMNEQTGGLDYFSLDRSREQFEKRVFSGETWGRKDLRHRLRRFQYQDDTWRWFSIDEFLARLHLWRTTQALAEPKTFLSNSIERQASSYRRNAAAEYERKRFSYSECDFAAHVATAAPKMSTRSKTATTLQARPSPDKGELLVRRHARLVALKKQLESEDTALSSLDLELIRQAAASLKNPPRASAPDEAIARWLRASKVRTKNWLAADGFKACKQSISVFPNATQTDDLFDCDDSQGRRTLVSAVNETLAKIEKDKSYKLVTRKRKNPTAFYTAARRACLELKAYGKQLASATVSSSKTEAVGTRELAVPFYFTLDVGLAGSFLGPSFKTGDGSLFDLNSGPEPANNRFQDQLVPGAFVQLSFSFAPLGDEQLVGFLNEHPSISWGNWTSNFPFWNPLRWLTHNLSLRSSFGIGVTGPLRFPSEFDLTTLGRPFFVEDTFFNENAGDVVGIFGKNSPLPIFTYGFRITEFTKIQAGFVVGAVTPRRPTDRWGIYLVPTIGISVDLPVYRGVRALVAGESELFTNPFLGTFAKGAK